MTIRTAADLRLFLANAIEDVAAGRLDVQRAAQIQKMAGQITESLYAEVKVRALQIALGRTVDVEIGRLELGPP